MICTRSVGRTSGTPTSLGDACPDCGHTLALHPGDANPMLYVCQVCDVADAVRDLRGARDAAVKRLGKLADADQLAAAELAGLRARVELLEAATPTTPTEAPA